jgi:hypothetical protein
VISYITLYSVSHDLAIINYTAMIYSDPQVVGLSRVANYGKLVCVACEMRTDCVSPSVPIPSDLLALIGALAVAVVLPIFQALGPIFAFSCSWCGMYTATQ